MFKKEIKKITKWIILGSIIILWTAWVYATNSSIQTYISNFSASDSEIWKLINGFFDTEGYIETEFIKDWSLTWSKIADNSITETQIDDNFIAKNSDKLGGSVAIDFQKKLKTQCTWTDVIQSITQDWTVVCVGSWTINWWTPPATGWKFVDWTNPNDAVYTTWNVGIGTTSPSEKLEVNWNVKMSWRLRVNWNVDWSSWEMWVTWNMIQREWNAVFWYNGWNVWIGTGTPGAKLDVDTSVRLASKVNSRNIVSIGDPIGWQDNAKYPINLFWSATTGWWSAYMWIDSPSWIFNLYPHSGVWKFNHFNVSMNSGWKMTVGWTLEVAWDINTTGRIAMNNSSPTMYFQDTDWRSAMLHNNSNLFYILRWCWNNSKTWCATNWRRPLYINLDNNDAFFWRDIYTTWWNMHSKSFIYYSDRRLKKDIKSLDNSLYNISKLRGVRYSWKKSWEKEIWLIAQEVEKIYPDLVETDKEDGMKSVKYGNIVAILIEGVKELYNKVVGNSDRIDVLEKENVELKERLEILEGKIDMLIK